MPNFICHIYGKDFQQKGPMDTHIKAHSDSESRKGEILEAIGSVEEDEDAKTITLMKASTKGKLQGEPESAMQKKWADMGPQSAPESDSQTEDMPPLEGEESA